LGESLCDRVAALRRVSLCALHARRSWDECIRQGRRSEARVLVRIACQEKCGRVPCDNIVMRRRMTQCGPRCNYPYLALQYARLPTLNCVGQGGGQRALAELPGQGAAEVEVTLVALRRGVHALPALQLTDDAPGRLLDTLAGSVLVV